jgi:hypothetical protein
LYRGQCCAAAINSFLINDGNGLYEDGKYDEAEINYRKALEKSRLPSQAILTWGIRSASKEVRPIDQGV